MKLYKKHCKNINTISFSIVFPIGSANEPIGLNGITHLIEHLSFRKANCLVQSDIYDLCEISGVNIHARTTQNSLEFFFRCRKSVFSNIVSLLADMIFECNYSDSEIELEKDIISNEILISEPSNMQEIVNNRWINHAYAQPVMGTVETIEKITKNDICLFKKRILGSNPLIVLLGNYSQEDLSIVKNHFSSLSHNFTSNTSSTAPIKCSNQLTYVKDNVNIIDVYYSFHHIFSKDHRDSELVCLHAIDNILMRGDKAYLMEIVREKYGLLYEIDSNLLIHENEAVWIFRFSVHRDKLYKTISLVEKCLCTLKITENYFKYHKAFFCDNVPMLQDDLQLLNDRIVDLFIQFKRIISPDEYADKILNIPLQKYNAMFENLIKSKQVVIFGRIPKSQKKEIEKIVFANKIAEDV